MLWFSKRVKREDGFYFEKCFVIFFILFIQLNVDCYIQDIVIFYNNYDENKVFDFLFYILD